MNSRRLSISLFLLISIAVVLVPTTAAQPNTIWSFCASDGSPVTYVSRPFDTGMNRGPYFNGTSIGTQFSEYLKGRFDTKTSSSCSGQNPNEGDAVQRRQSVIAQLRQQNKQVVEVPEWTYVRDEVAIKASFAAAGGYVNPEGGLPNDHIYCVTDSFQNTIYYTGPYPKNTDNMSAWSIGYFKYLQQKYSFKGDIRCNFLNAPQAKLYLDSRLAGAKAGGKQVVNSDWRWEPSAVTTQAPAQDEDREPAQKPKVQQPAPSAQVRDLAAKEVSPALALCQNNPAIKVGFNCVCLQTKIYDYRIAHPADTLNGTPTLASFFDAEQASCVVPGANYYTRMAAQSAGLKLPAAQQCVGEKFVALLHAKPVPSYAKEAFDAAIKACRQ